MRLKFYSNENFHLGAVEQLRSLGYDVLTSLEAGRANQRIPDEQVLEFARQESRAVLTFNRLHFVRLHKQSAIHHGILVCSEDPNFEALALRIHQPCNPSHRWRDSWSGSIGREDLNGTDPISNPNLPTPVEW